MVVLGLGVCFPFFHRERSLVCIFLIAPARGGFLIQCNALLFCFYPLPALKILISLLPPPSLPPSLQVSKCSWVAAC